MEKYLVVTVSNTNVTFPSKLEPSFCNDPVGTHHGSGDGGAGCRAESKSPTRALFLGSTVSIFSEVLSHYPREQGQREL